jgi:hypothetical protein
MDGMMLLQKELAISTNSYKDRIISVDSCSLG